MDHIVAISTREPTRDMQGRPQPDVEANMAEKVADKLAGCANFLTFNDYFKIDKLKLVKAITCQQHLVCPFCANRRAMKMMRGYVEKVGQVLEKNPNLKPAMITFTVKNGDDLAERFEHLAKSMRTLINRRRDSLKKGRGTSEWMKINGAAYSFEVTYNEETGWHPHAHMVALLDDYIKPKKLSKEWHEVTGDSFIVDVREIRSRKLIDRDDPDMNELGKNSDSDLLDGLAEVVKYAVKFNGLEPENVWKAYIELRGKRLLGAFGSLWGVKIPEGGLDDPLEAEPFYELFFNYSHGSSQYQMRWAKENGITPVDIDVVIADMKKRDAKRAAEQAARKKRKGKPKRRRRWEPSG